MNLIRSNVYATDFDLRNLPFEIIYDVYSSYMLGGFLRKLGCKIRPNEITKGQTNQLIENSKQQIYHCISHGDPKEEIFKRIVDQFTNVPVNNHSAKRPKVSVLGDLYIRDNDIFNQNLTETLEEYGVEVITTPFTYIARLIAAKINQSLWDKKRYLELVRFKLLIEVLETFEKRFFQIANKVLHEEFPTYNESIFEYSKKYDLSIVHGGETSQNVIKIYSQLEHNPDIKLFIHVNPIFCCPGLVSESIFKKIENDINIPIVSLTYDGTTTNKNEVLAPYIHYILKNTDQVAF